MVDSAQAARPPSRGEAEETGREAIAAIRSARDLGELQDAWRTFLARNGRLKLLARRIKLLSFAERREIGQEINKWLSRATELLRRKQRKLLAAATKAEAARAKLDVTVPGRRPPRGAIHPLHRVQEEVEDLFLRMGFAIAEGRHVEEAAYNFDKLNIGPEHPAREEMSTFWLTNGLLLRTHTSAAQVRVMSVLRPPFRILIPGRVFRYEATDATHDHTFHQFEGLMVDREVSVAHFKAILNQVLQALFRGKVTWRMRPGYFPFVEPGFEIDLACTYCGGGKEKASCAVCGGSGWLEIMGAGMIHPQVLTAAQISPRQWQGFAFGGALDRLVMLRYRINDIRLLHSGDLRFLQQFA
jgi:phenylalanyl-tRNA synthetase alpha chain